MCSATASILHADLDAFYASVEQRDDPSLAGRPVIVGGGVVLAASYEAKARGVRTAMGGGQARRLCPDAVVVPPRMSAYSEASAAVFEVFGDTSPIVEALSIDEAFLDVGGLRRLVGEPSEVARRLRERVRDEVGLAITVGVARTKFLAKVASGVAKPDGLLVVEPDHELDFLHPLHVSRLWGVGPVTAEKLERKGIRTVGDVAAMASSTLVAILGPAVGRHLHALAHNRDPRPVEARRRRRSIGSQRALGHRLRSMGDLHEVLLSLVDRVAPRLRASERVCRTVTLRFRYEDLSRATRSSTMVEPAQTNDAILAVGRRLLDDHADVIAEKGITLLGLAVSGLDDAHAVQLSLPFERRDRVERDRVVDDVRDRFGSAALRPAALLGHSAIEMPMLADPPPDAGATGATES